MDWDSPGRQAKLQAGLAHLCEGMQRCCGGSLAPCQNKLVSTLLF